MRRVAKGRAMAVDTQTYGGFGARDNEAALLAILEASPIAVGISRRDDGRIAFANTRLRELHGFSDHDIVGKSTPSLYDDVADRRALLKRLDEEGSVRDAEVLLRTSDGNPFWALISLYPFDLAGEPGLLVWIYDISERKRAEEERTRQSAIVKNVLETMDEGVIMVDQDMRVVAYNGRYASIYEFSSEYLDRGPNFHDAVRDWYEQSGSDEATLKRAIEGTDSREPFHYEWTLPNGRVIEVRHLPRGDGWFVRMFTDITERRTAELGLVEKTAAVHLLHRTATTANQARTINEAIRHCLDDVCRYTGWPVGHAFIGTEGQTGRLVPTDIWHLDGAERFTAYREATQNISFTRGIGLPGRVLATGRPQWIVDVRADPGFLRAAVARETGIKAGFAAPVLVGDQVEAVLEFFSLETGEPNHALLDVMAGIGAQLGRVIERTRAEQQMRTAMEAAEQASRAKSSFLASMSHELRTPLSSIIGFTQLLGLKAENALTEKQLRYVDIVSENAHHLLNLINELLDHARIEAGRIDVQIETLVTDDVIEECMSLAQPLASEHGITLIDPRQEESLPAVRADQMRLKQVLVNLISNAIKYNRDGGTVTLAYDVEHDRRLRISVVDTGPGIPAAAQSVLFQPFERLGAERSTIKGTGIGLVLAKQLIELMDGSIGFESTVGEGSTFWVELPLGTAPGAQAPQAPRKALTQVTWTRARPEGYTLLYIEDSVYSLGLMRELVERLPGVSLITADDGTSGLTLAREHKPDVVVLDINLPDMDGFEVLRHLAADEATRDIPVLGLSAGAMTADIERARKAGFADYLTKPIDLGRLVAVLDAALSRTE
jgi:PAS domain S-box-containing protein